MRSPLRAVAATLLAGTAAGLLLADEGAAAGAVVAAGAAAAFALRRNRRAAWTVATATLAAVFGLLRGADAANGPPPVERSELARIDGVVLRAADFEDDPSSSARHAERVAVFRVAADPDAAVFVARLRFRDGDVVPAFLPGDRVRLVGSASPVRRPTNPGEPDRRTELTREGVRGEFDVKAAGGATDLGVGEMNVATRVRRVGEIGRRVLLDRLRDACGGPGPTAALLGCLLLGDRSDVDDATNDAFRDSGTAHLLSVSGLHVVLLAAAAGALARRLAPRRARRLLGLPTLVALLVVYCALCRFVTPVVRAAVFLAAAETARAAGRRPSPIDTLAAAASLVVAVTPTEILDPGFQLSFAAVAGLALLARGFRATLFPSLALYRKFPGAVSPRRLRLYGQFATAMAASLAASVATAPVAAAVFGRLQPIAPLSNLVAVPLAAFLLPMAAALALVGGAFAWLTAPLAAAAVWPLRVAVGIAARMPCAVVETGRPPAALLVFSVALLVAATWTLSRRPRAAVAMAAASWLALGATPFLRGTSHGPEIVALDVGHGLCVLARSGDGGDVLFDAGGHVPGLARRTILPALRELGVRRLAVLFISHQDSDHCNAAVDLLDRMPVGEVVVSPGFGGDPLPRAVVAKCRARATPVTVVARGDSWIRRGIVVRVLSPRVDAPFESDNTASIVAHVTLGTDGPVVTAVVPGDVEGAPFHALANDATAPPAHVLLLPHHGRGDPAAQTALARRFAADVLVASTSPAAPMSVPGALVTGIDGAVRVRGDGVPAAFPWPEP
jgi:competence protein ComEC